MLTSARVVVSYSKVEIETAMKVIVEMDWACRNIFGGVLFFECRDNGPDVDILGDR